MDMDPGIRITVRGRGMPQIESITKTVFGVEIRIGDEKDSARWIDLNIATREIVMLLALAIGARSIDVDPSVFPLSEGQDLVLSLDSLDQTYSIVPSSN